MKNLIKTILFAVVGITALNLTAQEPQKGKGNLNGGAGVIKKTKEDTKLVESRYNHAEPKYEKGKVNSNQQVPVGGAGKPSSKK